MTDTLDLKTIFRMMLPSDMTGLPKARNGKGVAQGYQFVDEVLKRLFDKNGGGALTVATMQASLGELFKGATTEQVKQFNKNLRLFFSGNKLVLDEAPSWSTMYKSNRDSKATSRVTLFEEIVSMSQTGLNDKDMAIILSDSHFVNPTVRSAENAQLFLNFIPTHVMSRCVPYLSVEFAFDRQLDANSRLAAPSQLRFLLGAAEMTSPQDKAMQAASTIARGPGVDPDAGNETDRVHTVSGMEMFCTPQSLVNANVTGGNRYVPVLDPFRPFMSIEGVSVNVTPTVGLYSYKKASLTLKLHDRSRLSEIADLIQPLVYTKTTVWLTYGWRHPVEYDNPYANLINGSMLVREAYGICNSSYDFDQAGQVTINLELYTKGVRELRDMRLTRVFGSLRDVEERIRAIAEEISSLRHRLNLDPPTGLNKEIRAFQVLDAAEDASFPSLEIADVLKAVKQIEQSFLKKGNTVDNVAASRLKELISTYYQTSGRTKKFVFDEERAHATDKAVADMFEDVLTGPDPFATFEEKEQTRVRELGDVLHNPFATVYERYNTVATVNRSLQRPTLVSFGKIFSSLLARAVTAIPGIDELQVFYYTFNDRAGHASNQNIAEFPINVSVLRDQLKSYITKRRSTAVSVEELLRVITEAQLQDPRGPGYGFNVFFEPYDSKNPDPTLKKGSEQNYENALATINDKRGTFRMPTIDVYVETTYKAPKNEPHDLLTYFDSVATADTGKPTTGKYARVMRVHVFDKQVDPYPVATSLLKTDDGTGSVLVNKPALDAAIKNKNDRLSTGLDGLPPDIRAQIVVDVDKGLTLKNGGLSNDAIKRFVSSLVPSIVLGGNASNASTMSISTKQDPQLSAIQMLANKSGRPSVTQPNGGGTGGLPLRIIPAAVTVSCLGCPAIGFGQKFFIDAQSGTTVDNIYLVTGLMHTISSGKFETQMNLTWADAYGSYEAAPTLLQAVAQMKDVS